MKDNKVSFFDQITAELNRMDSSTGGVCDLCAVRVDLHPCAEHHQAALGAQMEAVVVEQDELWAPVLGVDTSLPQEGTF